LICKTKKKLNVNLGRKEIERYRCCPRRHGKGQKLGATKLALMLDDTRRMVLFIVMTARQREGLV